MQNVQRFIATPDLLAVPDQTLIRAFIMHCIMIKGSLSWAGQLPSSPIDILETEVQSTILLFYHDFDNHVE